VNWTRSLYGEDKKYVQSFHEKTSGERQPGGPRKRWEVNIMMDFGNIS
jgi:hypothetical protein